MSISLPNGTILAAPSSSQAQVSAAVTRILHLANFTKELKTRDIQAIFKEWEGEKGGFRIKWVDDVNALVVFADASVAKRAYLSLLLAPPPSFLPPASIRPYDRPDAAHIIASLQARTMGHRASMSSALASGSMSMSNPSDPSLPPLSSSSSYLANSAPGGISGLPPLSHGRAMSMTTTTSNGATQSNGLSGFTMPLKSRATIIAPTPRHQRTGSASSSWARTSIGSGKGNGGPLGSSGVLGGGVLNFGGGLNPSASSGRLPTHSENSSVEQGRSASGSADEDGVGVLASRVVSGGRSGSITGSGSVGRRASVTADKALREVQKALASVEAQG